MVAHKYSVFSLRAGLRRLGLVAFVMALTLNAHTQVVELVTDKGTVKLLLYNDTPLHKANFIKNIRDGKYNGVLFHRVIRDFMVQSGDPASVDAPAGKLLGADIGKETVPAEIKPHHYHKRGALAAARQPDETNPDRKSSQYQFYLVAGRLYTTGMLKTLEKNQNRPKRFAVADSLLASRGNVATQKQLDSLMKAKDYKTADLILDQMTADTDSIIGDQNLLRFSPQQIEAYTTMGGVPNLDGKYTVFGEVLEGLEIIDLIGQAETDGNNRPKADIHIVRATVLYE